MPVTRKRSALAAQLSSPSKPARVNKRVSLGRDTEDVDEQDEDEEQDDGAVDDENDDGCGLTAQECLAGSDPGCPTHLQDLSTHWAGSNGEDDDEEQPELTFDHGSGSGPDETDPSSEDVRDEDEINMIKWEIQELNASLADLQISKRYKIVDKLGEGTFSTVYKAVDCMHPFYDNSKWSSSSSRFPSLLSVVDESLNKPDAPVTRARARASWPERSPPYQALLEGRKELKSRVEVHSAPREAGGRPVYVALKRIYVSSSPQRIMNELEILGALRNARNTAYLISALRFEDQVLAVMPYTRHQDFRTYYKTMSLHSIRHYFKCLMSALADAHAQGIIHRDVKPANFLWDIRKNTGTLCDFGLAQRFSPIEWRGKCLHSLPKYWEGTDAKSLHGERLQRPHPTSEQMGSGDFQRWHCFTGRPIDCDSLDLAKAYHYTVFQRDEKDNFLERWQPVMRPHPEAKIGYLKPEFEKRPAIRADRAGTRGFRAPEVLLKCPDQTVAVDIWSVGVTLLCILTRRFPFFISNDDTEALLETSVIFGKRRMEKCAATHNRSFLTNVPTIENPRYDSLHKLVRDLCPNIFAENIPPSHLEAYKQELGCDPCSSASIIRNLDHERWYYGSTLWQAVDLMKRCFVLDCTKRITAADALEHPFLKDIPVHGGQY